MIALLKKMFEQINMNSHKGGSQLLLHFVRIPTNSLSKPFMFLQASFVNLTSNSQVEEGTIDVLTFLGKFDNFGVASDVPPT